MLYVALSSVSFYYSTECQHVRRHVDRLGALFYPNYLQVGMEGGWMGSEGGEGREVGMGGMKESEW